MFTQKKNVFDVELKITMSDETGADRAVTVYGFHSGTELRKTIESTVSGTLDMMDEMFGNQLPSPTRDPNVQTKVEPLSPLDLEEELLGDVSFVDGKE